jgi:hypothetical protein
MPTPRNLENVLQQKGYFYMTKEGEEENAARTSGGGEWSDVVGGIRGIHRGGVEWLVTGADVGTICGGKISGGTRFCTENVDLCTVKNHLISKADLKSEWLYMNTTDTRSRRKTASLEWGVPSYDFGGRGEELSCTMMSTVQFKRFSEILLVQVDGGAKALDMDWAPIVETVMRPLEYSTPRKVKFQPEPVLESLEDLGWNDVVPRGATNSDEDSDPAFDDSLRTNQLAIHLKLMRMNIETLERRLTKGLVSYEEALESLGSQVHATRLQVRKDSGIYTSGEESVWEGIAGFHVKMDSMESRIRSEILFEIMPIIGRIKSDAVAGTSELVNREVALATRQLSSEIQSARHEHHVAISSLESDLTRIVGLGGLSSRSHICGALSSDFPADWELVLDFLGHHTSPGSGCVGDKIEDCVARFDVGPSLPVGVWPQPSLTEQPGTTSTSVKSST